MFNLFLYIVSSTLNCMGKFLSENFTVVQRGDFFLTVQLCLLPPECSQDALAAMGNRMLDWFSVIMSDTQHKTQPSPRGQHKQMNRLCHEHYQILIYSVRKQKLSLIIKQFSRKQHTSLQSQSPHALIDLLLGVLCETFSHVSVGRCVTWFIRVVTLTPIGVPFLRLGLSHVRMT